METASNQIRSGFFVSENSLATDRSVQSISGNSFTKVRERRDGDHRCITTGQAAGSQ